MTPINLLKDISLTARGILAYNFYFKFSCNWSEQKINNYQFKKIKKLLIESQKNVPYYKELFHQINFDPKYDFNDLADLQHIPVLTKQKAKEVRQYLDNPKYAKNAMRLRTSGSTGEPFEVAVSNNAWIVEQAMVWRHWAWGGYSFRDKLAMVRSYAPKPGERFFKHDKLRNFYMFSPFKLNDNQISNYLRVMKNEGISILRGYPSSVLTLADYVKRTGHEVPNLKLILTASESLTNQDRELIENVFNTKISNHYGLAEIVVMMGDCGMHCGMHNYDDYGYLELHDTETLNHKKIIGTNLHNLATPLIRYDTGDIAEVNSNNVVTCNHTFHTVQNIIGRKDQQINTPEGYKIPTVNFYTMFESFDKITKWQIVQHDLKNIEFIIKVKMNETVSEEQLIEEIYKRLPKSIEVKISRDKYFIQKNEGKINPFISYL
jgi:phenylacetate-CoA ligase